MSCSGAFTTVLAIFASLLACNMGLLTIAGISGEFRKNVDRQIQALRSTGWGSAPLRKAIEIWLLSFVQVFGRSMLAWRFFLFTPIYTILVTCIVVVL